jgi:hypothetical protein
MEKLQFRSLIKKLQFFFNWVSLSDHPYISYVVEIGRPQRKPSDRNVTKLANIDKSKFKFTIK